MAILNNTSDRTEAREWVDNSISVRLIKEVLSGKGAFNQRSDLRKLKQLSLTDLGNGPSRREPSHWN